MLVSDRRSTAGYSNAIGPKSKMAYVLDGLARRAEVVVTERRLDPRAKPAASLLPPLRATLERLTAMHARQGLSPNVRSTVRLSAADATLHPSSNIEIAILGQRYS